jgi:uncharacterized protein (DUF952 family)
MIYHITSISYYQSIQSNGSYIPETFRQDGFIHCSSKNQVIRVANTFFPNHKGMMLLEIDETKLHAKVVFENLEGGVELFPHIYGNIPNIAISQLAILDLQESGFVFPLKWFTKDEYINMVK